MSENKNHLIDPETLISLSLRIGVYSAAAVIALGLIQLFSSEDPGYPSGTFPTTVAGVFAGLALLKPAAVINFGLFILIATPIFRVAASVILFLAKKDYLYVGITVFVLAILLISLIFGKAL